MSYGWANETVQYTDLRTNFTIGDGTLTLSVNTQIVSEGGTPEQAAALIGQIKDACEAASLTVSAIELSGGASKSLQEV